MKMGKIEKDIQGLRKKLMALEEKQKLLKEKATLEARIKKVEIDAAAAEQKMRRKKNEPIELRVTSPQKTTKWKIAQTCTITWLSTGLVGDWVRIDLLKNGKLFREIVLTASLEDGSFCWSPPDTLPDATDYQIRLIDHTGIQGSQ